MFSAYVTATGQAWADFDVYMPERWADDLPRRRAAGIPEDLGFATKPELAIGQLKRLMAAGLPVRWAAFDEVYGRSGELRKACAESRAGLRGHHPLRLPGHPAVGRRDPRAMTAVADAVFERRSCGTGTKGPRYQRLGADRHRRPRQFLLIRRLISRPDQLTFYLCWAPEGRPATMTYFITIAGRRWPVEETFKTGKDVLGWDQCQARTWDAACRHTALAALAQLRQVAIRNDLCGLLQLPPAASTPPACGPGDDDRDADDADLRIELPRVFRTGNLRLFHAASCPFRYSSRTSCGVRYPSVEWRRVLL